MILVSTYRRGADDDRLRPAAITDRMVADRHASVAGFLRRLILADDAELSLPAAAVALTTSRSRSRSRSDGCNDE
jgi:hypothetical protein